MSAVLDGGYRSGHDDRTFHYAIAASLVLHALLLFAVPGLREKSVPDRPGVLVAHIVEPPRAAPPEAVARPPEPPKPHVEPRVEPIKPPPVHKPSPIAERSPEPAPPPPVAEAAPPSAEPAPVASVPAPTADAQATPSPDQAYQGSLKEYAAQLAIVAGRNKNYPRVAVDNVWEGNVQVELVIAANGVLRSINVKTSSGHAVLDQQAMAMFRRAKAIVPIPPALVGKEFTVTHWVTFGLKDGG